MPFGIIPDLAFGFAGIPSYPPTTASRGHFSSAPSPGFAVSPSTAATSSPASMAEMFSGKVHPNFVLANRGLQPNLAVWDIAIDPVNPTVAYYVRG